MLKIQLLDLQDGTVALQLAGRIVGPWVGELNRSCERLLGVDETLSVPPTLRILSQERLRSPTHGPTRRPASWSVTVPSCRSRS